VLLKKLKWCAPQHLSAADRLPLAGSAPAADVANGVAHPTGAHLRHPLSLSASWLRSWRSTGRAEGQDGAVGAALVQFERELNVINPEERPAFCRAPVAAQHRVHQRAGRPRAQAGRLQLGARRVAGSLAGIHAGESSPSQRALEEAQGRFADVKERNGRTIRVPQGRGAGGEVQRAMEVARPASATGGDRIQQRPSARRC